MLGRLHGQRGGVEPVEWNPLVWLAALGFGLCYLTGCALAVRAVGRTEIFTLLTHAD